ncbi:haloacid dehalogenase-like hydrolase [Leptolyngbya sp. 7M]|uniref:haloacid dehalogenase-like hydrolase n=1 Tax=Leptolyngbya sp. 7M TaxID=2812896 RepID=UPI001B8BBADC|nr:HAD family hydrolase [Leptolyngbya sp. 7M]QYO64750.1 haloacid dehalogenase-like hydrolase [Leptolyngbya sp. 7M]
MISPTSAQGIDDPLPSWNDGEVKQSIIEFVTRVTTENSPDFVPIADRIATFDNDGTLWAEQPVVQGMFVLEKLQAMAAADPSLTQRQPFQAALERDVEYFKQAGEAAIMELLTATHTNMTQEQFQQEVQQFFATAIHPTLNLPYTKVTYRPMVELLEYLRANQFQTWICSGGGIDFMRVVSESLYGIPPEQVIGSFVKEEFIEVDGKDVIWRLPEIARINDQAGKPIGIDLHIGKRPVFAAGNERTGGDIAMLTYSQQQQPSFSSTAFFTHVRYRGCGGCAPTPQFLYFISLEKAVNHKYLLTTHFPGSNC